LGKYQIALITLILAQWLTFLKDLKAKKTV